MSQGLSIRILTEEQTMPCKQWSPEIYITSSLNAVKVDYADNYLPGLKSNYGRMVCPTPLFV